MWVWLAPKPLLVPTPYSSSQLLRGMPGLQWGALLPALMPSLGESLP